MDSRKEACVTFRVPRFSRFAFFTTPPHKKIPPERPPPPVIRNYDITEPTRCQPCPFLTQPPLPKPPLPPKPVKVNEVDLQPPPLPPKSSRNQIPPGQFTPSHNLPPPLPPRQVTTPPVNQTHNNDQPRIQQVPSQMTTYQKLHPPHDQHLIVGKREPLPENLIANSDAVNCLACRDFNIVDRHAANFPRNEVASLESLAHNLTSCFSSKTDKARAIFMWLHYNVAYDAESFFSGRIRHKTPKDTVISGLAVCQGYAELFKTLGRLCGLDVILIQGHCKGYGYEPSSGCPQFEIKHAWNAVRLDSGHWHLIESCWGAGYLNDQRNYVKKLKNIYFVGSPEQFRKDHFPENPMHQFCPQPVSWNEYLQRDGPTAYSHNLDDIGLSEDSIQPQSRTIQPRWTKFLIKSKCDHVSIPAEEQYVLLLTIDNEIYIPFEVEGGRIWSCEAMIKPGSKVYVNYVHTLNGRDAKGVGVKIYKRSVGKVWMSFQGLCMWDLANCY